MEALWMELQGTGVKMLVVNPGPVKTEWQSIAGYDDSTPIPPGMITAEQCVSDSLEAYDRNKRSTITGRFFPWFMRASKAPKGVKLRVAERMYRPRN
jgi:short-subunit dehydrogenase